MSKTKREVPVILELECIRCGETKGILQKFTHRTNVCEECRNKLQKIFQRKYKEQRREGHEGGRKEYPLGDWKSQKQKFNTLKRELSHINDRSEWIDVIRKRLDALGENAELYKWIIKHQSQHPVPIAGGAPTIPRERRGPKSKGDLPNTKDMPY
mgnify:CR=1 FL=1